MSARKPAAARQGKSGTTRDLVLVKVPPAPTGSKPPRALRHPPIPAGLGAHAQRVWRDYWSSRVSDAVEVKSDTRALEAWILAVDEFDTLLKLQRQTPFVAGSTGQVVLNPAAQRLTQLQAVIARYEDHLGLTPLARHRLGITIGQDRLTAEQLNRQAKAAASDENKPSGGSYFAKAKAETATS